MPLIINRAILRLTKTNPQTRARLPKTPIPTTQSQTLAKNLSVSNKFPPQICTSLIDGPLIIAGCDLLGRPIRTRTSNVFREKKSEQNAIFAKVPAKQTEEDVTVAVAVKDAKPTEMAVAVFKPWPYALPAFLSPVKGTTFDLIYGGQSETSVVGALEKKPGWLQYLLYGVPAAEEMDNKRGRKGGDDEEKLG